MFVCYAMTDVMVAIDYPFDRIDDILYAKGDAIVAVALMNHLMDKCDLNLNPNRLRYDIHLPQLLMRRKLTILIWAMMFGFVHVMMIRMMLALAHVPEAMVPSMHSNWINCFSVLPIDACNEMISNLSELIKKNKYNFGMCHRNVR